MELSPLRIQIAQHLKILGYDLYDLEYVNEHRTNILRVMIDKPAGIDIDDCVVVSESLSPFLDGLDPIPEEYSLEVSSPGAERKLRNREEIAAAIGKYVHVETDEQKLDGELTAFQRDIITLKNRNKMTEIGYLDVTTIRLAVKF